MRANYGYSDASGDYFLIVDTDKCDGCGKCVEVCPSGMLEVVPDDYDKPVVLVKDGLSSSIGYVCVPCGGKCVESCEKGAIEKGW